MSHGREHWSYQIVNYLVSTLLNGAFSVLAAGRAGGFFPEWAADTKAEAVALAARGVMFWDFVWAGIAILLALASLACAMSGLSTLWRVYLAGFKNHDNKTV